MHPDNKSLILKPSEIAHHKMCVSPCALYVCQWETLEMKKCYSPQFTVHLHQPTHLMFSAQSGHVKLDKYAPANLPLGSQTHCCGQQKVTPLALIKIMINASVGNDRQGAFHKENYLFFSPSLSVFVNLRMQVTQGKERREAIQPETGDHLKAG